MRNLLLGIILALGATAIANAQTQSEVEAYKAFTSDNQDPNGPLDYDAYTRARENRACFIERMCAAGPIGANLDCENSLNVCLIDAVEGAQPGEACIGLFAALTPTQHAMLAAPTCNGPPPASALQPAFTASEAQCLDAGFEGMFGIATDTHSRCTSVPATANERGTCRTDRYTTLHPGSPPQETFLLYQPGACRVEIPPPVLWSGGSSAPNTVPTFSAPTAAPRTWQEEVQQIADQPVEDFDFGDL
jgi:hypothetical protein